MDYSSDVRPHRRLSPAQLGQDAVKNALEDGTPVDLPTIERRTRNDDIVAMEREIEALSAEVDRCAQKIAETHAAEARVQSSFKDAMTTIERQRTQYTLAQSQAASRVSARIRSVAELKQADLAERFGSQ